MPTMSTRRRFAALAVIALAAFALRAVWLLRGAGQWMTTPDSAGYVALAHGLLHGCGFAVWTRRTCGPPEVLRTPGYPVFIALFGGNWRAILSAQALMGGMLVFGLGLFAWRQFSFRAAILAALLVATDVPSILASKELMSETMFQFVLAAGVLLLAAAALSSEKRGALMKTAAGGFLVAAASLVRPVGELLVPFLWLPFALTNSQPVRQRIWMSITAVMAAAGVLICWAGRNHTLAATWTLSTDGAFAVYYYATPPLLREDQADSRIKVIRHNLVSRLQPTFSASAAGFPGSIGEPDYDSLLAAVEKQPSLGRSMYHAFANAAVRHPLDEATICAEGLVRLALQPYSPGIGLRGLMRGESSASTLPIPSDQRNTFQLIVLTTVAFQILWLMLAWSGALMALARVRRLRAQPLSAVLIAFWVFTILLLIAPTPFFGVRDIRYRTPIVPLLAILAGMGWFEANHIETRKQ